MTSTHQNVNGDGSTSQESDIDRQLARMHELLSKKEAELVGVKAELFTRRREAEEVNTQLATLEQDHRSSCLELELEKLREMEELWKGFDRERRQ